MFCVFIDYKSEYNTANRDVLLNYTYQQKVNESRRSMIYREAIQLSLFQDGDRLKVPLFNYGVH
jgi:hypothetical protein